MPTSLSEARERLHQQIMNLHCRRWPSDNATYVDGYKEGHRDARHAAAELVQAAELFAQPAASPEVAEAVERLRGGFSYDRCPDGYQECNDARTIAEHYLAQPLPAAPDQPTATLIGCGFEPATGGLLHETWQTSDGREFTICYREGNPHECFASKTRSNPANLPDAPAGGDDGVAVDEAWLSVVGFETVIHEPSIVSREGEIFTYRDGSLWCDLMRLVRVKTRGAMRRAAAGLNIQLTEPAAIAPLPAPTAGEVDAEVVRESNGYMLWRSAARAAHRYIDAFGVVVGGTEAQYAMQHEFFELFAKASNLAATNPAAAASAITCYLTEEDPPENHDLGRYGAVCGRCYNAAAASDDLQAFKDANDRLVSEAVRLHDRIAVLEKQLNLVSEIATEMEVR